MHKFKRYICRLKTFKLSQYYCLLGIAWFFMFFNKLLGGAKRKNETCKAQISRKMFYETEFGTKYSSAQKKPSHFAPDAFMKSTPGRFKDVFFVCTNQQNSPQTKKSSIVCHSSTYCFFFSFFVWVARSGPLLFMTI